MNLHKCLAIDLRSTFLVMNFLKATNQVNMCASTPVVGGYCQEYGGYMLADLE